MNNIMLFNIFEWVLYLYIWYNYRISYFQFDPNISCKLYDNINNLDNNLKRLLDIAIQISWNL